MHDVERGNYAFDVYVFPVMCFAWPSLPFFLCTLVLVVKFLPAPKDDKIWLKMKLINAQLDNTNPGVPLFDDFFFD